MSLLAAVKHRSASGNVDGAAWEYTDTKGLDGPTVYLRLVFGRHTVDVDIPVCSLMRPRAGAWILIHHHGSREVWLLTQNRVPTDVSRHAVSAPFQTGMVAGSVELMSCPPEIARELEAL